MVDGNDNDHFYSQKRNIVDHSVKYIKKIRECVEIWTDSTTFETA